VADCRVPSFWAALPIPGVEGTTVRRRFSGRNEQHLQQRVRAKTGTLTEPYDAVSLAGFSRLNSGSSAAFAIIVNGTEKNPAVGVERIRDAMDADLSRLLPPSI